MKIRYRRELGRYIEHLGISGDAAEVGVAEGLFAEEMLSWPVGKVYLVDRWTCVPSQRGDASHPQEWHDANLRRVKSLVEKYGPHRAVILQGESYEVARFVPDLSLALVNIDGDHSFHGVLKDIHAWLPKVGPGGLLVFHDYLNPSYGVKQAVDLLALSLKMPVNILAEDRPEDASAYFILR